PSAEGPPAAGPSSALRAATASETPIAAGLASNGRTGPASPGRAAPGGWGSSDIVGSSVRDPRPAVHWSATPGGAGNLATVCAAANGGRCPGRANYGYRQPQLRLKATSHASRYNRTYEGI